MDYLLKILSQNPLKSIATSAITLWFSSAHFDAPFIIKG